MDGQDGQDESGPTRAGRAEGFIVFNFFALSRLRVKTICVHPHPSVA
jgi:hypothetical protein